MTVCIGLVCNSGKRILLAADTRASYGAATSNDQTAKLFDLPAHFCGAVAGTLSQCEDVISELYHRMAQIPDSEIAPEQVRRCIVDSYDQIYAELADQALRNDLRITLDQYKHDKKLVSKVRQSAQDLLKSLNVDADLIVAGFYKDQPVQLVAGGGTSLKVRVEITPGNAVIGSGAIAALKLVELQEAKLHVGIGSLIVASNGSQAVRRSRAVGWAVSSDDLSMAWRIQAVGGRTRIDSRMVEQVWVALER